MKLYAIKIGEDWYVSHAGTAGNGCLQTIRSMFPTTFYSTQLDASEIMRSLLHDFPEGCREIPEGRCVRMVRINYSTKER